MHNFLTEICTLVHICCKIVHCVIWDRFVVGFVQQVDFTQSMHLSISSAVCHITKSHYSDIKMGAMKSQITSLTIVYSTVYSGADQRKHKSSASLAFVRGIHCWPVNYPHKGPVTRKMFPFDDVIMKDCIYRKWKYKMHSDDLIKNTLFMPWSSFVL